MIGAPLSASQEKMRLYIDGDPSFGATLRDAFLTALTLHLALADLGPDCDHALLLALSVSRALQ
jgi:hypothetical protein